MAAQFRQHADVKAVEVNNTADMSKEDVSVGIQKLDGANMGFA
jgi:DNA-binding transcriptional regulator GbsR (MarR family)